MKHISILVLNDCVLASIADPRYMFTAINQFLTQMGKNELFKVQLVGMEKEVKLNGNVFSIHPDILAHEVEKTDLIVIPALSGDIKLCIEKNEKFIPWIQQQYEAGAEVASLCIGAFMLASTGLLEGKKCSTHWLFADLFREMFPKVELVDDKIVTEQNRLYSSGGASSYWNLLLYLVEKYTNREMAILASKFFAIDFGRDSQSGFILFQGQKNHNDESILKAQQFIEENYAEKISIDFLAEKYNLGKRSFERRFKNATKNTVNEYIQRVKIEAAKKNFEISRKNIHEVMFEIGYNDVKSFREVFKKITGHTPIEYRNKYQKTRLNA